MTGIGDLVTCRQTGSRLWVVKEPLPDNRFRLIGVRTDRRGRADYSTCISGAGDVQVIWDAEVYAVGAAQAVADFEVSQTLARAREAVELAAAKHDIKPEAKDATLKAMNQAEQGLQRAIDKIGERASLIKGPHMRW